MHFVSKYAVDNVPLDSDFIESFKGLVKVVLQRIEYEESSLYPILAKEK